MISSFDRIDSLIEGVLKTFVKKKGKICGNLCNPIAIASGFYSSDFIQVTNSIKHKDYEI